ncbi:MAG TPA: LLM class F420-dependent oxidoreductase [Actinocrinis sp.]|uniref:LLM class F420-dependent oxidoreductase n=1 Tax=Actinocrinis sp. TaxID=1920516 RepID=UPI002DDCC4D0|nr:LLM class F420-dependent oxidoreductase [Actinocrinis sp.]HEV3171411.1 LLM class F420-dependent oxidoreductase [Actinocrinis sp.]
MDLRIFTEPQQGASYETLLSVAKATEELGFDGFFRSDHYLAMGSSDGLPGPTDAWVTLAGLARETSRIRLGTLVSPATFRLPGPLAIQVAQVDQMSGGRAELGLGTGWFEAEHRAYGIGFPEHRFGAFEEQLEIVTGLWDTPVGETFSFRGEHYTLEGSPALPKPVQTPHPPIIIGGGGAKRTPRLAAAYAAEYNFGFEGLEQADAAYGRVRAAAQAAGRDADSLVYSYAGPVVCGRTDDEVARRADAIGRKLDDELRQSGFVGTPGELVERIAAVRAIGVSRVYLQVLDLADLDHLELLAAEVARQLD